MTKQLTTIALTGLLLLMPGLAAADSKTASGSICSPLRTEASYFIRNGGGMTLSNSKSIQLDVHCTIVRERTNNAPIKALEVRFRRYLTNSTFPALPSCTVFSTNQWGEPFFNQSKLLNPRSANRNQLLKFTNVPTRGKGTVTLRCGIPSQWSLGTIYWDE